METVKKSHDNNLYAPPRSGHPSATAGDIHTGQVSRIPGQRWPAPSHQRNAFHAWDPQAHLWFAPERTEHYIVHLGEGTTTAGKSSEVPRGSLSLCYRCCREIPLQSLRASSTESCGEGACNRTRDAGLAFIKMPESAADACEEFKTFLVWWMEKVDRGVDAAIEKRSRERVLEARGKIPRAG